LTANIVGYVSLSQLLSLPALIGPFLAGALYCAARVLGPLLSMAVRVPWIRNVPEIPAAAMEHWIDRLLSMGALFLWATAMLHLLTIFDRVKAGVSSLLQQPLGFDKIHFTLAGASMVVVIVLIGYVLAKALTFLLQNFVLTRLRLKRGLPYAISKVTYYFCLVLVGLAALSAAGVELNKFTVLTGALGVGLGFGMQNIVNNFVSGLILIFERPIHVGDIVDVGGLEGTVRRIGARSSTVVTFQGAEVIVPNSNLLSNQLINWTLSSPWRRIDIPIKVAYGTDPEQVTKLLVGVAESHPGVLLQRPPVAFFRGFGESALNFELRFWSSQQDTWLQLQSDVTVAVAKALGEAGIEIPFPQRDLHIRSADIAEGRMASDRRHDTSAAVARDHSVRT
jgi:potassium efflux system protein